MTKIVVAFVLMLIVLGLLVLTVLGLAAWVAANRWRTLRRLYPLCPDGLLEHVHQEKLRLRAWDLQRLARIRRGVEGNKPWSLDGPFKPAADRKRSRR